MVSISQQRLALEGETAIADLLWKERGGEREVVLPEGLRADLVTDDAVYEVKHVSKWADAVKVLLYAAYFPGKRPVAYIFGLHPAETRARIQQALAKVGIGVEFRDEPFGE